MTALPTSTDGQPLGKRGVRTRQRILEAIASAIEQQGLRGLRLADVANEVGFSQPAFYQYFADLDDAILALCEEVGHLIPDFPSPERAGNEDPAFLSTREFVARFFDYWDEHRAVLYARNVAVTAGDERFQQVRNTAFQPMTEHLRAIIEAGQREGRIDPDLSPKSLAGALTVMLDRLGMLAPQLLQLWRPDTDDDLIEGVTYIFDRALGLDSARSDRPPRPRRGRGRRQKPAGGPR